MADIHIEFISSSVLKRGRNKADYILDHMKSNTILVLEDSLSLQEEKELIRETMKAVSKNFPGIEISTLGGDSEGLRSSLIKMLGGKSGGLTVIGPSKLVRKIKRDPESIHLFARPK